ncbi:DNA translocase FtsK [Selenomonadales bacterium OttesenSCG-928-I06]|nr:DNA translocase FtsK [Selenomonadales bacterium OttesenSCG-928-I06]
MNIGLKFELLGVLLVTFAILFIISLLGFSVGSLGTYIAKLLNYVFGIGAIILPAILIIIGWRYIVIKRKIIFTSRFLGVILLYFLSLALVHSFKIPMGSEILPESLLAGGGFIGGIIVFSLRKILGMDGSVLVILGLMVCSILLATNTSLVKTAVSAKNKVLKGYNSAYEKLTSPVEVEEEIYPEETASGKNSFYNYEADSSNDFTNKTTEKNIEKSLDIAKFNNLDNEIKTKVETAPVVEETKTYIGTNNSDYSYPPLSLLKQKTKSDLARGPKNLGNQSRILEQTLESFGVQAKVINVFQGPTITRYELEPALGVKVSRIVNLADDIALKLATSGIRMEAPIPGKAAIGIEVPNREASQVLLRDVLETDEFKKAKSALTVGLGKDIAGKPIITDLTKMPHLLVAGATGAGKSVCINTLICSVLFKSSPEELKLILIDPKMVELANYNGIPHLLTPVVTNPKKAASALNWAVEEMERRYTVFASNGVRDITRYNEMNPDSAMPLILIIIDELADLMMVAPAEIEDSICRLAQKARACGIHLVLATQRPSVNVITGTIKANIPSRISFVVSSQIDSRTILDMAGAEKLLGRGDMLFLPTGALKPYRIQGAFISDEEIESLVEFIKEQDCTPEYVEEVLDTPNKNIASLDKKAKGREIEKFEDELLESAATIIVETTQASTSMLQRRFRIGYTRAARIIDTLEEMQIITPNLGNGERKVLITMEELDYILSKKS